MTSSFFCVEFDKKNSETSRVGYQMKGLLTQTNQTSDVY